MRPRPYSETWSPRCLRRFVPVFAATLLSIPLASPAAVAAQPSRPWPDRWPIVLPPLTGASLPTEPPSNGAELAATPAAERVMDVLARVQSTLTRTRYQHQRVVREHRGMFYWDCALMVEWVLQRAAPRALRRLPRERRPRAVDFVRAIERAPTDRSRGGWRRLRSIDEIRPGDVFAWRRPPGFPSRNTGHVGFVTESPRRVVGLERGYAVRVADASRSSHQRDTRAWPGEGGFGIGTLVFLADQEGHGTHYGWGGTRSRGYVTTPIFFGRLEGR